MSQEKQGSHTETARPRIMFDSDEEDTGDIISRFGAGVWHGGPDDGLTCLLVEVKGQKFSITMEAEQWLQFVHAIIECVKPEATDLRSANSRIVIVRADDMQGIRGLMEESDE